MYICTGYSVHIMSYHRIYIAKAVQEEFSREENKSGLVNHLLLKHYGKPHEENQAGEPPASYNPEKEVKQPRKSGPSHPSGGYVYSDGELYDTKKEETKLIKCKNGHIIPQGHDKCLQPKCKYSGYGK